MAVDPILQELMDLILPPDGGDQARSTSDFGSRRSVGSSPHGGFDTNRGRGVQPHGRVTSPVRGVIKEIDPKLGRIVIEERDPITGKKPTGYDVEILHTQTQTVKPGDPVKPRQPIGTQGDVGAERGAYHAHIQVYRGDRSPLNPLRHLFEYHYPGELIPALPQFEPRQLPPRAKRGPASLPGNQGPLATGADGEAPADPFQQGGKPIPYLAQTHALDPALEATNWPQRRTSSDVLAPNTTPPFAPSAGALRVNPVPYLHETRRARQALDASRTVGTEPDGHDQPNPLDSAEWPFGPVGAPTASVKPNDIARQDFSALKNFRWYRPSYLPPSDAASPAAPIPSDGSLTVTPLMTPGITQGVGRIGPVVAPPISFIAAAPASAPGGIPGLLKQAGADPSDPDQPPASGLLRLLQEYMRNSPASDAVR